VTPKRWRFTRQPRTGDAMQKTIETVVLRPTAPADEGFLYEVYASTRAEELACVPWDEQQKADFLRMQFAAQHRQYHETYPDAAFDILLVDGQPAGRLYVDRGSDELRIIDIALFPPFRNRGIGRHVIEGLQAEATRRNTPLRIHVERFNPALRLYWRLGFREVADRGVYLFLEWSPPQ
jgi:ribosomal protein S18 acetylase RimI-like enzyme